MFDLLGASFSLISTVLFIRLSSKAWLVGLAAVVINGCLYWHKGIYGEMVLELIYLIFMCYGWYHWNKSKIAPHSKARHEIITFNRVQWSGLLCAASVLYYAIYYILTHFTDSTIARIDAFTTSMSLLAQCLMCYKIIATWILWFITDSVYAYLYFDKQLFAHTLLMMLYLLMAIAGYRHWSTQRNKTSRKTATPPGLLHLNGSKSGILE